ncbi:hypothetical protein ACLB2K_057874 [Fragaria x ananassa]
MMLSHTPECPICLEDFAASATAAFVKPITALPCTHHYHVHCIVQWMENSHLCTQCQSKMINPIEYSTDMDQQFCSGEILRHTAHLGNFMPLGDVNVVDSKYTPCNNYYGNETDLQQISKYE